MGYAKNGHLRVAFCFSRYLEDRPVSRLKDPRPDAKVQFERTGIVDLTGYLTDFAEGGFDPARSRRQPPGSTVLPFRQTKK
jgi:hypothetical protein